MKLSVVHVNVEAGSTGVENVRAESAACTQGYKDPTLIPRTPSV